MAATILGGRRVSARGMGLLRGRPLVSLPADANCSGTWTLISSLGSSGMVITALHLGQGPRLPANFSLTEKRALQPGQRTAIGIGRLSTEEAGQEACSPLVWHGR